MSLVTSYHHTTQSYYRISDYSLCHSLHPCDSYFITGNVYLLIPSPISLIPLPPSPMVTIWLVSVSLSLFLFCCICLFCFVDSTYK